MSLNKIFAAAGFLLALFALFVGTPHNEKIDTLFIAKMIESEQDHITPLELADQIFAGKKIRLIDLRDSASYQLGHVHNAELMSMEVLLNGGINKNEQVVLYSAGGVHASQAWVLLKTKQFRNVLTLLGGFSGWNDEILHPLLNTNAHSEEKSEFEHRKLLSLFFGGEPRTESRDAEINKLKDLRQSPNKKNPPVHFQKEEEKLRDQC